MYASKQLPEVWLDDWQARPLAKNFQQVVIAQEVKPGLFFKNTGRV